MVTETPEVPQWRLHLLRAAYLLMIVGVGVAYLPNLFVHSWQAAGIIPSMLGGMWVMAWFGLRYPLKLLPLLMLDFVWKTIWAVDYGIPFWRTGRLTEDSTETLHATLLGVFLMPLVLPWGYVMRHYFRAPAERWRA